MKKTILFLLAGMASMLCSAQSLSGVISNQAGEPMPFVTVAVMTPDSSIVGGSITDERGEYVVSGLHQQSYILSVSYVGYKTIRESFKMGTSSREYNLTMEEETVQLKDVEIKAKRPLIERQFDKLVLNVASSPFALGSNGKELLKKAPGVNIDKDGNVTVNGKSVEVYIDGRPSYLSGEQLKALLEGTDGSTVEKIEIISNPSAKYDASGQGGIINIKTKRNMMKGLNGTLAVNYGGMYFGDIKQYLQMDAASLNLNYRTDKTYTFGQLTQVYAQQQVSAQSNSITPVINGTDTLSMMRHAESPVDVRFQYYLAKIGNDWFIDDRNTLGFIVQVPLMIATQSVDPAQAQGYVMLNSDTTETNNSATSNKTHAPQHTFNLNYTHIFDKDKERELTVNMDYNRYSTDQHNTQTDSYKDWVNNTNNFLSLDINTKQRVNIYSAKVDFQTKFWGNGMLETGAKWALSSTNNRMTTDSVLNGTVIPTLHSDFDYNEQVAALYISAAKQFGEHWSTKLGLRGEYTHSVGKWISSDSHNTYDYFNLFPTAFVGYNPNDKWHMSASYTRRIKRPSYYTLNPFRSYLNAHAYSEGNPDLKPEFNNDVEFNFAFSRYVSLTLNFSHTQRMFSQRSRVTADGDLSMRWENFGTCTTHGGNISFTEIPVVPKYVTYDDGSRHVNGAWLTLTANGGYYHFINRSYDKTYKAGNHWGYASGTLTAYLPKDWTLSVDGRWNAAMIMGYNYTGANYSMGLGLRKMFQKPRLILNFQIDDLLRSNNYKSATYGLESGQEASSYMNYHQQRARVTLVWMFGTQQYMKQRKVGDLDENSRLGTGSN